MYQSEKDPSVRVSHSLKTERWLESLVRIDLKRYLVCKPKTIESRDDSILFLLDLGLIGENPPSKARWAKRLKCDSISLCFERIWSNS